MPRTPVYTCFSVVRLWSDHWASNMVSNSPVTWCLFPWFICSCGECVTPPRFPRPLCSKERRRTVMSRGSERTVILASVSCLFHFPSLPFSLPRSQSFTFSRSLSVPAFSHIPPKFSSSCFFLSSFFLILSRVGFFSPFFYFPHFSYRFPLSSCVSSCVSPLPPPPPSLIHCHAGHAFLQLTCLSPLFGLQLQFTSHLLWRAHWWKTMPSRHLHREWKEFVRPCDRASRFLVCDDRRWPAELVSIWLRVANTGARLHPVTGLNIFKGRL